MNGTLSSPNTSCAPLQFSLKITFTPHSHSSQVHSWKHGLGVGIYSNNEHNPWRVTFSSLHFLLLKHQFISL